MDKNVLYGKEAMMAGKWLVSSGIQNQTGERSGGINSWYDLANGSYSYVYSEITGYGVTALLYLGNRTGDKEHLKRAVSAAEWLASRATHPCGGVRTRDYYADTKESDMYSFDSENIYAFDNGMVLYGIVRLYKDTEDIRHLKYAERIADFLLDKMAKPDGTFYAVYNANTQEKEDSPRKWSSQSGSYHAKLAMGFMDLYQASGKSVYKDAALKLCLRSMDFQEASGRFVTNRGDGSTHFHPNMYSVEGLMYTGNATGESDFLKSAARGFKWALSSQKEDGGVPKFFDGREFSRYCRSDVLSQVLRAGVILYSMGELDPSAADALKRLRERLLSFQYGGNDAQKGGFLYGHTLDGARRDHVNSWCTMFALQALMMYDEVFLGKTAKLSMDYLI